MKKLISVILAMSILLTMSIPAIADRTIWGDVNDDGNITAVDARIILQIVAGVKEETDFIKSIGDVNFDGKISAVDARIVLQVVAGIISAPEKPGETEVPEKTSYGAGETWVVPGQWEITINSVKTHSLCNSVSNEKYGYTNQQVVILEYTYKNLGIEDGLYVSPYSMDFYDEDLATAQTYACTHDKSPKKCIVGAKCTTTQAFILENYSSKVTVVIEEYDSNNTKHKATFEIPIEGVGGNDNTSSIRADEKLKNYITTQGIKVESGNYGISKEINGLDTTILYDAFADELTFACNIKIEEGETLVYLTYNYGETRQEVTTSTVIYPSTEKLLTVGFVNTATFSETNKAVELTLNKGWGTSENARQITATSTSILLKQTAKLLEYTGAGVTLHDLGFVAW